MQVQMQVQRDPYNAPSLFSLMPGYAYDFQLLVFLGDESTPAFSKTYKNIDAAKDGTYVMTYANSDHTLWNKPLRVILVDLTSYKGNQGLLRMRLEYNGNTVPIVFKHKSFKTSDQRTIRLDLDSTPRFELHMDV